MFPLRKFCGSRISFELFDAQGTLTFDAVMSEPESHQAERQWLRVIMLSVCDVVAQHECVHHAAAGLHDGFRAVEVPAFNDRVVRSEDVVRSAWSHVSERVVSIQEIYEQYNKTAYSTHLGGRYTISTSCTSLWTLVGSHSSKARWDSSRAPAFGLRKAQTFPPTKVEVEVAKPSSSTCCQEIAFLLATVPQMRSLRKLPGTSSLSSQSARGSLEAAYSSDAMSSKEGGTPT